MGHIINLLVNAFLWVKSTEDLEFIETETQLEDLDAVQQWRRKGPLGKMHNIVVHIQSSPQRQKEFSLLSKEHRPARDNETRWNSWAHALKINTTPVLKDAFNTYVQRHIREEVINDALSDEDWQVLHKIQEFLQFLECITLELESNFSTLDCVLSAIDLLLSHYELFKESYSDDNILSAILNAGWRKLDKYYSLSDITLTYVTAIVLNPGFKLDYI